MQLLVFHVGFTHEFPPEFLVARDRPSHRFEREYKVDTANAVYGEMTSDPSPQFWKSYFLLEVQDRIHGVSP